MSTPRRWTVGSPQSQTSATQCPPPERPQGVREQMGTAGRRASRRRRRPARACVPLACPRHGHGGRCRDNRGAGLTDGARLETTVVLPDAIGTLAMKALVRQCARSGVTPRTSGAVSRSLRPRASSRPTSITVQRCAICDWCCGESSDQGALLSERNRAATGRVTSRRSLSRSAKSAARAVATRGRADRLLGVDSDAV